MKGEDVDDQNWREVFDDYHKQLNGAQAWTEPSELKLRVCAPDASGTTIDIAVQQLQRAEPATIRAVVDAACVSAGLHRDAFFWVLEVALVVKKDEVEAAKNFDLLCTHDAPIFSRLWQPENASLWEDEHSYCLRLVAIPKPPPASAPTEPPIFDLFTSPPPDSAASAAEWSEWNNKSSCGCYTFWKQRSAAVHYRYPSVLLLHLQGVLHSVTVHAAAADPLAMAAAAFAAAAEGPEGSVSPSELLLSNSEGDVLDPQTTSARSLFLQGTETAGINLQVVWRDMARTKAERSIKHGPVPEGYMSLQSLGYLVADTEAPWLVSSDDGMATYNHLVDDAFAVYNGFEYGEFVDGVPSYNLVASWWEMLKRLKKSVPEVAERALQKLTGMLLATFRQCH
jgi:hypothetical protein